ncbi:hypothetical protein E8K88_02740 [Lampropedia aestuarii]|uniref:Uncharacterized protein n=1 Tax=Lampropedia aestuarii TaxID=2562762 RepID=A0A4S5C169_9BURK|nr:hypothetical protein [Lampropedia aestuarii]THJ36198.1 hypothetical protein E8K88_02740 [Lampropedia aestuarii]
MSENQTPHGNAQPIESVLIDGTAYAVPAPVAAELLRLHLLLKEGENPVAGQSRFGSELWGFCTHEHVRMVLANPRYAADGYEARYLYTRPHVPAPPPPQVNILAEIERHAKAHIIEIENLLARRF